MAKILVVDDEQNIRDVFKRALENGGHEAVVAENGIVGQQKFLEHNPEIVILDI
ncbi:MAG: hypothetical protein CL661_04635 [Bacteroidetes bacterium]|jgi:two-component system response regulator ResD|nr:hypothetical protein [Bacteroidota bacterium]|tara:strand:- start:114 stop:275 length:162 start_codon:yes stop_codon:yes gene_type:complete